MKFAFGAKIVPFSVYVCALHCTTIKRKNSKSFSAMKYIQLFFDLSCVKIFSFLVIKHFSVLSSSSQSEIKRTTISKRLILTQN